MTRSRGSTRSLCLTAQRRAFGRPGANHLGAKSFQRGFSLVELLIVIVLMGILSGLLISSTSPSLNGQLTSTGDLMVGELAYARSLAVGNNSSYRFDVDVPNNRLVMRYTGADPTLTTLPANPYRSPVDPPDQYILALANLPRLGPAVTILGAQAVGSTTQIVTSIEFGAYGQTTQVNPTILWLTAGSGTRQAFLPIQINPVTGLATAGVLQTTRPSGM
jgi:prepilin-type N-terminal cleavage/methylation domain-containing protein